MVSQNMIIKSRTWSLFSLPSRGKAISGGSGFSLKEKLIVMILSRSNVDRGEVMHYKLAPCNSWVGIVGRDPTNACEMQTGRRVQVALLSGLFREQFTD